MFTRQAVSATNNGGETCSIANQPGVAMAEFNLNLDGGIPWQEGKIQGISNYSRHQMLPMIAASWRHLSPPRTSDAVSMQQEQETSVQDQGILVRRKQSSETVTALEPIS